MRALSPPQLRELLLPLLDSDEKTAIELAQAALGAFTEGMERRIDVGEQCLHACLVVRVCVGKAAEDDACRRSEVSERAALTEKLGVGEHS